MFVIKCLKFEFSILQRVGICFPSSNKRRFLFGSIHIFWYAFQRLWLWKVREWMCRTQLSRGLLQVRYLFCNDVFGPSLDVVFENSKYGKKPM
jgi:hypothetical protein